MKKTKVLVIGSGGREHALGWALNRSDSTGEVHAAPGNPGLLTLGPCHAVGAGDVPGQVALARKEGFDLVVIGPEQPLALGLADRLREQGIAVFGPGASGARLESSKAFAKTFMERHRIPTARFEVIRSMDAGRAALEKWGAPVVIKASGLAAGKGVILADSLPEAEAALAACLETKSFGDAGSTVLLEEKLEGEEVSIFVVTDGENYQILPTAQDHKRAYDGDQGPNTGGMGAFSPATILTDTVFSRIKDGIIEPTLEGLRAEEIPFQGLLYVGIMLTSSGPRVLEYNVRFGDPETQVVLPRLGIDLGKLLMDAATGGLDPEPLPLPVRDAAVCVVAAGKDYPRTGSRGIPITGTESFDDEDVILFHAGTATEDKTLVTSGGRVLNVVGVGESFQQALDRAYTGMESIHFEGMRFRRDIGTRALASPGGVDR